MVSSLSQATFISFLFFFWLVIVHSISTSELIHIDEKRFYLPKIVLCCCIWASLASSLLFISWQETKDPSFFWKDDIGNVFTWMQVLFGLLLLVYAAYFAIISYIAFFSIK